MTVNRRIRFVLVPVLLIGAVAAACDGVPAGPTLLTPTPVPQRLVLILVSGPSTYIVGRTYQLTANTHYSDGTRSIATTAQWRSTDTSIATVSATGLVTAASAGAVDFTATVQDTGGTAVASSLFPVTVSEAPPLGAAIFEISPFSGSYDGITNGIISYSVPLTIAEIGGRGGATFTAVAFSLSDGKTSETVPSRSLEVRIEAGQTISIPRDPATAAALEITSPFSATHMTVTISFIDDRGQPGTISVTGVIY